MKKIWFFPFVFSIIGLFIGIVKGVGFVSGLTLAFQPLQESAALFIFGSVLIALAGFGRRKQQNVLARQSKEDWIC